MLRKQLIGFAGAIAAWIVIAAVALGADRFVLAVELPSDTKADRLAFAARWLLIPGIALLIGIVGAARRGFYAEAIDGTRTPANHALEINLRYNTNTLEQTVMAAIAWAGLALQLPIDRLVLIPAAAILFGAGRIAFWIGYLIHLMGRAFGMVLTIFPTMLAYGWLVWTALGP